MLKPFLFPIGNKKVIILAEDLIQAKTILIKEITETEIIPFEEHKDHEIKISKIGSTVLFYCKNDDILSFNTEIWREEFNEVIGVMWDDGE